MNATHEVLCDYYDPKERKHVEKWFPAVVRAIRPCIDADRVDVTLLTLPNGYRNAEINACSPDCVRVIPANAATARKMARDAERDCNWAEAARLYDLAADIYPSIADGLSRLDVHKLRTSAAICRTAIE